MVWGAVPGHLLLFSMLFSHHAEASFLLRNAAEDLYGPRTSLILETEELHNQEFDATTNTRRFQSLDIDWWFVIKSAAITSIITVALVVGLCVCIKFGEGKQAEHWGRWEASKQEVSEDEDKAWTNIEVKMQKTDIAQYVEATDYQQLLKNMAQKVGREKAAEDSKTGALQNFIDKTFRLNDMRAADAVIQGMSAQEAMRWLQLQPASFGSS